MLFDSFFMCLYIDGDPSLFWIPLYFSFVKGENRTPTNKATDCSSAIKLLSPMGTLWFPEGRVIRNLSTRNFLRPFLGQFA